MQKKMTDLSFTHRNRLVNAFLRNCQIFKLLFRKITRFGDQSPFRNSDLKCEEVLSIVESRKVYKDIIRV